MVKIGLKVKTEKILNWKMGETEKGVLSAVKFRIRKGKMFCASQNMDHDWECIETALMGKASYCGLYCSLKFL